MNRDDETNRTMDAHTRAQRFSIVVVGVVVIVVVVVASPGACSRVSSSLDRPFTLVKRETDGDRLFQRAELLRITHPLYLHTTAPKAGTTDREARKGANWGDYDNTRLVRTSLCTWILIGLRDYWSK
ncbi:hypothetical protein WN48_09144 [Eufriesea mexicana]|nr:hypothetical protein WN48_09144 [Eufriesea mexicana]